jgi:hypothetical protein
MRGHVDSLNVSVAAGVALFEAVRQRAGKVASDSGAGPTNRPPVDLGPLHLWHAKCYYVLFVWLA